MLRHLQIRDFAIIDAVELEFSRGLTVLTGETGAGKSIIVDALELLCRRPRRCRCGARRRRARRHHRHGRYLRPPAASCATCSMSSRSTSERRAAAAARGRQRRAQPRLAQRPGGAGTGAGRAPPNCCSISTASTNSSRWCARRRSASWSTPMAGSKRWPAQVRTAHSVWLALLNRSLELESAAE